MKSRLHNNYDSNLRFWATSETPRGSNTITTFEGNNLLFLINLFKHIYIYIYNKTYP